MIKVYFKVTESTTRWNYCYYLKLLYIKKLSFYSAANDERKLKEKVEQLRSELLNKKVYNQKKRNIFIKMPKLDAWTNLHFYITVNYKSFIRDENLSFIKKLEYF